MNPKGYYGLSTSLECPSSKSVDLLTLYVDIMACLTSCIKMHCSILLEKSTLDIVEILYYAYDRITNYFAAPRHIFTL